MNTPLSISARQKIVRHAAYAATSVAIFLIALKTGAYYLTSSVSILSSLLDSLLDASASIVNLVALAHAATPADHKHRFGHGKAEALAGLGQASFIALSAGLLIWQALRRIATPVELTDSGVGITIMVITIIVTLGLVLYQRRVIAKTQSTAISADSLHYASDLVLNLSVIISLILAGYFNLTYLDPIFAIGIAFWILWNAGRILFQSSEELMDREIPMADRKEIKALTLGVKGVLDIHDFRTRRSGQIIFVEIHVEMNPDIPLHAAHEIVEAVMAKIHTKYPHAEIIVHEDPAGVAELRQRIQ